MRLKKNKPVFFATWALIVLCALFLSCDLSGLWFGSNPSDRPPPNILSKQDSLAVRAILDANGLDTVKVRDVILLAYSEVAEISLRSRSLVKFVFSKYLDSLIAYPSLELQENNIDSLVFPDTIAYGARISLDSNRLRRIPDEIGKLRGAIALFVNSNQISSISPNIMHCNISYMNVNNNMLCNLPDSITQWITSKCRNNTWPSTQTCN